MHPSHQHRINLLFCFFLTLHHARFSSFCVTPLAMSQPHHHHHHHHQPRRTSASLIDSLARPTSAPLPPQPIIPTPRSPPSTNPSLPNRPSPLSRGSRVAHRSLSSASDVSPSSSNLHGAAGRSALGGGPDGGKTRRKILGVQERLRKEVDGVVKRRQGGVLARG